MAIPRIDGRRAIGRLFGLASAAGVAAMFYVAFTLYTRGPGIDPTALEVNIMIGGAVVFVGGSITAMTLLHR